MITYRVVKTSDCMSEADLDAQWNEGYELVAAARCDNGDVAHTFIYRGGTRGGRSVGQGN